MVGALRAIWLAAAPMDVVVLNYPFGGAASETKEAKKVNNREIEISPAWEIFRDLMNGEPKNMDNTWSIGDRCRVGQYKGTVVGIYHAMAWVQLDMAAAPTTVHLYEITPPFIRGDTIRVKPDTGKDSGKTGIVVELYGQFAWVKMKGEEALTTFHLRRLM